MVRTREPGGSEVVAARSFLNNSFASAVRSAATPIPIDATARVQSFTEPGALVDRAACVMSVVCCAVVESVIIRIVLQKSFRLTDHKFSGL